MPAQQQQQDAKQAEVKLLQANHDDDDTQLVIPDRTSSVITKPGPLQWYEEAMLFPHEAVRRDCLIMEHVTRPKFFHAAHKWKSRVFFRFYNKYFGPFLHEHHDNEEEVMMPWILSRVQMPPKLKADHKRLMQLMDDVAALEPRFATLSDDEWNAAADTLRDTVKTLCHEIREHLAEEERVIPPLLAAHFTEEEHSAMVQRIVKRAGLRRLRFEGPAVLAACKKWRGEERAMEWFQEIPRPIRYLVTKYWMTEFELCNRRMILSLTGQVEPKPAKRHGFGVFVWFTVPADAPAH